MSEKKLLGLLQQKRGFFESILDLTEEESLLPVPQWISNLEQKKILLSCVDELDEHIHRYEAAFSSLHPELAEELDKIKEVIGKILHLDAMNLEQRKRQFNTPLA